MTVPTDEGALLKRIASKLPYLSGALRQIAEFILERPDATQAMSITALAAEVGVAESTVSRFVREIGLTSYRALRVGIAEATFANRARDNGQARGFVYEGIARDDELAGIIGKIQRSSEQALAQTAGLLDPDAVERAVAAIESADTLIFTCMGSSSIAAEEGVMRFTRAGKKCILFRDQSVQAMVASIAGPRDVVIAISDSGNSIAVVDVVRRAREHGAATIAITSAADSLLARAGDVALYTAGVPSGGALYGEAVTAKWGQIMIVDVLYAAFAARHFDETLAHLEGTYAAAIEHSRSS